VLFKTRGLQLYELGQKSKEADFLLTLNSIIISNQGYPHQNSSFGQPRSDGSIVSIVHSSAGKLLLEYLLARRLCSSGYYAKYQMVFEPLE
jgi:hypothetical protein